MLEHLRVLDLTDERGLLCGRILADLGADVVHVEPPGGSAARAVPPVSAAGTSLYWATFGAGRRGVAVDLDDPSGLDTVRALAARADVLVTSLPRAWLEERGLDPATLRAANLSLVYTAVSAFGWDGPKAGYVDCDLVVWAAGGPLDPHRDGADRPPLRISVPQAYLHASADAAAGALIAVLARESTCAGQVVDVSAQASLGVATLGRVLADAVGDPRPEWHQELLARPDQSGSGAATPNSLKKWECRDGLVELHLSMGPAAGQFTNNLFGWLRDEGAVDERIASWDWREMPDRLAAGGLTVADLDEARSAVRAFLRTRTKTDVVRAALERRLLCMAIFDVADIATADHLAERGFWTGAQIDGREVRVPGRFAKVDGGDRPRLSRAAPAPGEHTAEVLSDWGVRHARSGSGDEDTGAHQAGPSAPGGGSPRADAPVALRSPRAPGPLKVLDLSWVVAGPLVGRALADFGAQVVRVESSRRVETARLMQPFHGGVADPEGSALFGNCNAGKLGITLDLASEDGRAVVLDLVDWADVVVESFSPGRMRAWGLGQETLRARKPSLVVLSTSIAGQDGPWSALAGYGNVGSSLSGFQHLVGWEDRMPLGPFGPYTDYLGPRLALAALLAAVENARRTGRGCYLDVAQVEAGVYFLSPQVAHFRTDGVVAGRSGNRDDRYAPHGVYPCLAEDGRDRFVAVVARDDPEWWRLARAIGREDLAERADLASAAGRMEHADELDKALAVWTSDRRAEDVESALQSMGIPAHVAVGSADYVRDGQLRHRGHLVRLAHPLHGETWVEGPRYRLSETPGQVRQAAPTLGQHTETVLRDLLGYLPERIAELDERGALT